jgi:hypothetical protein
LAAWIARSSRLIARSYLPGENRTQPQPFAHTTTSFWFPRNEQHKRNSLLLAEAESLNDRFVALGVVFFEVVEQATPLADQHEKTAARAMVFQVRFEVVRQLTNALAQQSDLDFWTARIGGMRSVLVNEGFLLLSG